MQSGKPSLGASGSPFPSGKPSKALQEEDAFMQAHGGAGCRFVYWMAAIWQQRPRRKRVLLNAARRRLEDRKYGTKHLL